ncbi:MAG TPA: winged helix-turn-helix domain-containing protein [Streptosporangiaceae bacterium]|jgi:DNA-binding transcriptional ArsR family regulator
MAEQHPPRLRLIHRALADPLRLRLFELLAGRPQSAKELAGQVDMRPERLYHHLAQLEAAKLIQIAEYRRLTGGKVERVYEPAPSEPAGDQADPAAQVLLFNAVLEITRADINAAAAAKEAGEDRNIMLHRIGVRLNAEHLTELNATIGELLSAAQDNPDDDGVWSTVVWTAIDRQNRRTGPPGTLGGDPGEQPKP